MEDKKVFYLIMKHNAWDGKVVEIPQGGFFDKEKAEKCCNLLNEEHKMLEQFAIKLYELGYYNDDDMSDEYVKYYVEETDVYDAEEITNPDTLEAIKDCETGENLESYDTFEDFYNKMLKEEKGD